MVSPTHLVFPINPNINILSSSKSWNINLYFDSVVLTSFHRFGKKRMSKKKKLPSCLKLCHETWEIMPGWQFHPLSRDENDTMSITGLAFMRIGIFCVLMFGSWLSSGRWQLEKPWRGRETLGEHTLADCPSNKASIQEEPSCTLHISFVQVNTAKIFLFLMLNGAELPSQTLTNFLTHESVKSIKWLLFWISSN